jgi:hypothetical protein
VAVAVPSLLPSAGIARLARVPWGTDDCRHDHEPQHPLHPVPDAVASEPAGGEQ